MKALILFVFCACICLPAVQAQISDSAAVAILKAINRDIWSPFSNAWKNNDVKAYMAIHDEDLIRSSGGQYPGIKNFVEYASRYRENFGMNKVDKNLVSIEFRFIERIPGETTASERGIFHTTKTTAKGEVFDYYGKFHVFHRKKNGVWRILIDYDSDENMSIGRDDWGAAFGQEDWDILNPQHKNDALTIHSMQQQYAQAWLKNEENTILSMFETGARIAPGGMCPVDSIQNIQKFWFPVDGSRTQIHRFEIETIHLNIHKDIAVSTQTTLLDWSYNNGKIKMARLQNGITTTIYRRQKDGQWKIWQQMWTEIGVTDK
jgi:ketosteroid isomerase-like protein